MTTPERALWRGGCLGWRFHLLLVVGRGALLDCLCLEYVYVLKGVRQGAMFFFSFLVLSMMHACMLANAISNKRPCLMCLMTMSLLRSQLEAEEVSLQVPVCAFFRRYVGFSCGPQTGWRHNAQDQIGSNENIHMRETEPIRYIVTRNPSRCT